MFRSARWRNEKNKIKVVFKLQFHATQVSQLNVDSLVISVVPDDVGKPTTKLEKSVFREGICRWEYPVYETVKFSHDTKTGTFNERVYHFIVSTGSSKNTTVGEVSINFADYAEATKVSTVSLPLKCSKSNGVLHVAIQRLQANVNHREVEETQQTNMKPQTRTLNTLLSNGDMDEDDDTHSNDVPFNNAVHDAELNGNCRQSSGSDITMSSSESSSGLNTPRELGLKNASILQDPAGFLSSQTLTSAPHKSLANATATIYEEQQQSQWEWLADSDHGISTDNSTNSSEGILTREKSQDASDIDIENLKAELVALTRQVDVSELELQTLRKQIVKESKRSQDFSREVLGLKEERDVLKIECERLKAFQKRKEANSRNKLQFEGGDLPALLEEIRQELTYEKDLNANLRLQLQKTQDSNAELILAVTDLEAMLEQKNKEISDPTAQSRSREHAISTSETDDDDEQKALEELVKEHRDAKETYLLEQRIVDLCSEIEIYKRDKDEVEMQIEQLALDYEILKQENHNMSYKLEQSQLQEQLKMQCDCCPSLANINELEAQIESLENELRKQSEEHSDSLATIDELKNHVKSLDEELEKLSQEHSDSLATIDELKSHIKSLEEELEKQSEEHSDSLATIDELKGHIKSLEEELVKQSEGHTGSLVRTDELESHIRSLEEELEKQAQGFEADLKTLMQAKVEQEQRAIRAEEALQKTRWKNANTAEKLQEEFRKLSMQMTSTFDVNEKVATKALAEASALRMQKSQLEDMLLKANEELQWVRDDHEAKLHKLSNQLNLKMDQLEQMLVEIDDKSKQLENQRKHEEELSGTFSEEKLRLNSEIERLVKDNDLLSERAEQNENLRAELEKMKTSIKHTEALVHEANTERDELENAVAVVKKESEKLLDNLNRMKSLKDETETANGLLKSEVEMLKAQCSDLKHSVFEDELEKEKLRKEVFQLKGDLKKKSDTFASVEKKLKESNKRAAVSDGIKSMTRNNKSAVVPHGSKEAANLREKIKLLEGQIKLKEKALEASANSFLEKERDLQNKIEELESRVEGLNQKSASFCDHLHQKLVEDTSGITSNDGTGEDVGSPDENLSSMEWMSKENGNAASLVKSNVEVTSDKELKTSTINNRDCDLDKLLSELESLKERNKSMEIELKEMQERYSEISLKFAEVEGERQQLVMTIRSLKNAKKL